MILYATTQHAQRFGIVAAVILNVIKTKSNWTVTGLSAYIGSKPQTVYAALYKLEEAGLVRVEGRREKVIRVVEIKHK